MHLKYRTVLLAALSAVLATSAIAQTPTSATGYVFHDANNNGRRDAGEKGLSGIRVSNQRDVTTTNDKGQYRLPVTDDTILFVVKPKGWKTPLTEDNLPKFYYIHKPAGSPKQRFPGVQPTGSLPASVDFPLTPTKEPKKFKAILFGDPQPRNEKEVEYVAHDVVEELIGTDASFGVTLGDIAFDNLDTLQPQNRAIALIGIPWYNVLGNHDQNYDSADDTHTTETFQSIYGPPYYSFDHGPTHFVVLDDVMWHGDRYTAGLGAKQMEWLRNDLAKVPKNQLVVLMMHIPLTEVAEKEDIFRLLEQRPYSLSISGHTHYQEHRFLTREDGWRGIEPHHHVVNVTVCGSWWSGAPDEYGIPHTMMRDGAPNGYSIFTFDGHKYSIDFKAARRPASHQMSLFAPEEIAAADADKTEVFANVFAGSERSTVEMRLGDKGPWILMAKVAEQDPYYAQLKALEESTTPPLGRKLPNAMRSGHLWKAVLPTQPRPGTHKIHVRTKDMFGKTYSDYRLIKIR